MNHDDNNIKDEVLKAIQSGDVKQRSRRYFVLRGILIGTGVGLVLVAVLYLASFIFFILRQTGLWYVPAFGLRGWLSFVRSAPWLLIALAAAFIIALEVLVRRYAFTYREPLAYSVFAILIITIGGGFLLYETSFHRAIFTVAVRQTVSSPIGALYRDFGEERFSDIHPGLILATTTGGFIIQEMYDEATATVLIGSDTALPPQAGIVPSDTVVVFGPEASDVIQAVGIKKAGSDILWIAPAPVSPACVPGTSGC